VTPERWAQVKEVFHEALELKPEERARYLDTSCTDPALRQEVESLLNHHLEAGNLMENPAHITAGFDADHQVDPWIGRNIGAYQAISKIGQGGMGTVYRAVRVDDHYLKHVAIKLVRSGFGSGQYLRRFRNERQIMASLDHPNVARLLDGGATEEGLPYLVMEYIDGQPIDEYCDSRLLNTVERLKLFCQVCSAVQYAHQSLIVHRDLKPGNILVTPEGVVKLLDFGIAKLLDPELYFQTVDPAATMAKAMTPEYASPEQVRGDPITTSSDVYSLAVVLYRLLTGHPPYRIDSKGPLDFVRVICEAEPAKPSVAIDQVEGSTDHNGESLQLTPESVSRVRDGRPAKLRRRLVGDLDNIVLMALRKDPARRYASVEQFVEDIRRYLDGHPVAARSDTIFYRTGKFVRRHRIPVAATIVVFASLVTGIFLTTQQARIAEAERARAERRFNDVRKLARELMFTVHDSIQYLPGATPARKLIVENALEYLDSLARESTGDVSIQRELAIAYEKVGDVQGRDVRSNLGDTTGALGSYRKSLAIRRALVDANPNDVESLADLAQSYDRLGEILDTTGNLDESLSRARQALDIRKRLVEIAPGNKDAQFNLALSYDGMGNVYADRGELDLALENTRKSLEIFESLPENAQDRRYRRQVALEHKKLGGIFEATSKLEAALPEYQSALMVDEELVAENPNDGLTRRGLSISYANVGDVLFKKGDFAAALKRYRQAATIDEGLAAADPKDAWAQKYLVYNYLRLGDAQTKTRDPSGALRTYERCLEVAQLRANSDPSNIGGVADLASSYSRLGALYFFLASQPQAAATNRRARLLAARSWHQKSLNLWLDMQKRGTLRGIDAHQPEIVAAEIAKCEVVLRFGSSSEARAQVAPR
jgi:eukaryotic-like serine/threonine-protein kinase